MAETVCSGGVCTPTSASPGQYSWGDSGSNTPWTVNTQTGYAGQKTLGDYYRENMLKMQQQQEMSLMYEDMLRQFGGPEGTWIRMLIKQKMASEGVSFMNKPLGEKMIPPAIPNWMEPYVITKTVPMELPEGRGSRRRGAETKTTTSLRPLSAQAELTPDQLNYMAGWLSWQKAGTPTEYSEEAFARMADIERSWTPYRMGSQSMFPGQRKPAQRWATAFQR